MAAAPQTWVMLRAIQQRVQTEILVGGVSPFTAFDAADAARFGTTNAIYVGKPKDFKPVYARQCHILPPLDESVYRRDFGGKIFDDAMIYVRFLYDMTADWYSTQEAIVNARDVAHVVMARHAELPAAPTVQAVREQLHTSSLPTGMHFDTFAGKDYVCWGFIWWHRQVWTVSGGITA